jgi:hypothetical protein
MRCPFAASTLSLGGTAGQAYGFTVSGSGIGTEYWSVGASGSAFQVANYSTMTVNELLLAANSSAVGGEPWGNQFIMRLFALGVFNALNEGGTIF